jgi:hypothetical protein
MHKATGTCRHLVISITKIIDWNPISMFGRFSRADGHWAGWLYATHADTGVWRWRVQTNYPIVGGEGQIRHSFDNR